MYLAKEVLHFLPTSVLFSKYVPTYMYNTWYIVADLLSTSPTHHLAAAVPRGLEPLTPQSVGQWQTTGSVGLLKILSYCYNKYTISYLSNLSNKGNLPNMLCIPGNGCHWDINSWASRYTIHTVHQRLWKGDRCSWVDQSIKFCSSIGHFCILMQTGSVQ